VQIEENMRNLTTTSFLFLALLAGCVAPGSGQFEVLPDFDGDGIPDSEDPDADGDGIPDTEDTDIDLGDTGDPTGDTGDPPTDTGDTGNPPNTGPDVDDDGDGFTENGGDCDDLRDDVFPGATEVCDGVDQDCDVDIDEGTECFDDDNDGFTEDEGDCNDAVPGVNPYASDLVGDTIDQNCDGVDGTDFDSDTYASEASGGSDCDDTDPTTYPNAAEVWYDGIDQQCDGVVEDSDQDGDGYDAEIVGGDDCADLDPAIHVDVLEDNTNGVDDNCNGLVDQFSVVMTWTPGLTVPDLQADTVYLTLDFTDLPEDSDGLLVVDGPVGNIYAPFQWVGSSAIIEVTPTNSAWDTILDADPTHTYALDIGAACYTWGSNPNPGLGCAMVDPTTL
jgi:hypothetical protein